MIVTEIVLYGFWDETVRMNQNVNKQHKICVMANEGKKTDFVDFVSPLRFALAQL